MLHTKIYSALLNSLLFLQVLFPIAILYSLSLLLSQYLAINYFSFLTHTHTPSPFPSCLILNHLYLFAQSGHLALLGCSHFHPCL